MYPPLKKTLPNNAIDNKVAIFDFDVSRRNITRKFAISLSENFTLENDPP